MKKVWFSLLAIGVLAFGIIGSTTNSQIKLSAQGTDEISPNGLPIQPPV
jgi:hypothetical protein